jgi:hypothetical protein
MRIIPHIVGTRKRVGTILGVVGDVVDADMHCILATGAAVRPKN